MSWETQVGSIINAMDDNVAKIKGRLYNRGETIAGSYRFDLPQVRKPLYEDTSPKPSSPYSPSTYSAAAATPEDLVTLSSQLLSQAKMITSLHQAIGRLERDRDHHLQKIQGLEEEVRRLSSARGDVTESLLDRKIEGLRQELSSELRHLQDRVTEPSPRLSSPSLRSTSSILLEVNENKRLIWKEYESLRRDMDYLHQRLRRQEDDLLRHLSDGQDLKRAQERNASVLEGLKCSHQMQVQEVSRTRSDTQDMQRDLLQIRSMIADLKEEMRHLEGKQADRTSRSDRVERTKSERKQKISKSTLLSSSEDEHSQLSLADISSEETSYSLSVPTGSRDRSTHSREWRTHSNQSDKNVSDDLEDFSDSPPELNFSDL